jgi:hypothetical protein
MLALLPLLSIGAIDALIPIIIIVILIAAAAGLSRGSDLFAILGFGTLIGMSQLGTKGGSITSGKGVYYSSRYRADLGGKTLNTGAKSGSVSQKGTKTFNQSVRDARASAYSRLTRGTTPKQQTDALVAKKKARTEAAMGRYERMTGHKWDPELSNSKRNKLDSSWSKAISTSAMLTSRDRGDVAREFDLKKRTREYKNRVESRQVKLAVQDFEGFKKSVRAKGLKGHIPEFLTGYSEHLNRIKYPNAVAGHPSPMVGVTMADVNREARNQFLSANGNNWANRTAWNIGKASWGVASWAENVGSWGANNKVWGVGTVQREIAKKLAGTGNVISATVLGGTVAATLYSAAALYSTPKVASGVGNSWKRVNTERENWGSSMNDWKHRNVKKTAPPPTM